MARNAKTAHLGPETIVACEQVPGRFVRFLRPAIRPIAIGKNHIPYGILELRLLAKMPFGVASPKITFRRIHPAIHSVAAFEACIPLNRSGHGTIPSR